MDFWNLTFLDNSARAWASALGATAIALTSFWLLMFIALRQFGRPSRGAETDLDDLIAQLSSRTNFWLLAIVGVYIGSRMLSLSTVAESGVRAVTALVFLVQVALVVKVDDFLGRKYIRHAVDLGLATRFQGEGIELAYPTQVVYIGERAKES